MRVAQSLSIGVIMVLLPLTLSAQDTFDAFRDQFQNDFTDFQNIAATGVAESAGEYQAYRERMQQEFEEFRDEMEQLWGVFQERTQKNWVEYTDEGRTKVHVDFETGKGSIEVLVDDPAQVPQAQQQMDEKLFAAISSPATELGYDSEEFPNRPVTQDPVLEDQLNTAPGESKQEYAARKAENDIHTRAVTGDDGVPRTVIQVNFQLAPDHIRTRAQKVADYVYRYAETYGLNPPLIFAVIHTESFFNPTAVSPANAFGLMQLVPSSGGADAYRAVYNREGIPTKNFLFNPDNNVNLGCAYLDILGNRYFENVEADLTRHYLAIAAYNTGPGNVARSYTGRFDVDAALDKINAMSDEQNFTYLVENLPFRETRNYLQKVVDRAELYEKWSEGR